MGPRTSVKACAQRKTPVRCLWNSGGAPHGTPQSSLHRPTWTATGRRSSATSAWSTPSACSSGRRGGPGRSSPPSTTPGSDRRNLTSSPRPRQRGFRNLHTKTLASPGTGNQPPRTGLATRPAHHRKETEPRSTATESWTPCSVHRHRCVRGNANATYPHRRGRSERTDTQGRGDLGGHVERPPLPPIRVSPDTPSGRASNERHGTSKGLIWASRCHP